mmetsp:Transcript_21088/g.45966  ORF Transcript_21088/g.45966 Transcript_21088/m.45966 type:complete len:361 (-) Transcript_21088:1804-2886(-)
MRHLLSAAGSTLYNHLQQAMRPTTMAVPVASLSIAAAAASAIQPACAFLLQDVPRRYDYSYSNNHRICPVASCNHNYYRRTFHSSPIALKKKRNRWKSARKYAAQMERMNEEVHDGDDEGAGPPSQSQSDLGESSSEESSSEESKSKAQPTIYDDPPDSVVKSRTLNWIKKVVVGLNLCPFAASPLSSNKLSIEIVRGRDAESIAAAVLLELILRTDEPGTTVVVAPECHPDDFGTYLEIVGFIEDALMVEHELHGRVQLAPFHPLFEFGGSGPGGIDNYTNRSPYPMFHVLREEEVGAAVETLGGDAGVIWQRNVKLLEAMEERLGRGVVEDVMRCNTEDETVADDVEEILKMMKEESS